MSGSTGQIIGTVVGGIIGAFVPGSYIALGAAIGGAIGGAIDPPKGPKVIGPKLTDLSVQTNTYGAQIPRIWGTVATFGNIFWVENNKLKETTTTEEQGGKGGGGQEVETTKYSVTFALGLCKGPITAVRRIWVSGKLIYDSGSTTYEGISQSNLFAGGMLNLGWEDQIDFSAQQVTGGIRVYLGTDDQAPDWRMQAALGVANTPAYRGLAYIVFDDFQLEDFGNSLLGAQFKVEVVTSADAMEPQFLGEFAKRDDPYYWGTSVINIGGEINLAQFQCAADEWYGGEQYKVYTAVEGGSFSSTPGLYMDVANVLAPSKYPWHTSVLWSPGSSSGGDGWRYGAVDFPYDEAGLDVTDWVVTQSERLIMIRDNVLELYSRDVGLVRAVAVGSATQMYYNLGWIVVIDSGTTMAFDIDLNQLYSVANSIDMTDKMLGGSNSGALYLMDQAGAQLGPNVYALNALGTAVTATYSTETITSAGGKPSFYVRNGILMTANMADPEPSTPGHQMAFTVRLWGLGGLAPDTVELSTILSDLCLSSNMVEASDIDVSLIDQQVRGYRFAETAPIRSAIEPLQTSWPFDVIQSGYTLKFVPRGGTSVASIPHTDLGAVAGGEKAEMLLGKAREMDLQLPRRVEITYFDAVREYDIGEQASERLNTDAVNTTRIELPIVLDGSEAAGKAEVLLYLYWIERETLTFVLPPTYQHLEPADVVTITAFERSTDVRLIEINYLPDGRVECTGKPSSAAVYVPTAVGEEGQVIGQTLTMAGPTALTLLDVPCLTDAMDTPGFIASAHGYTSGWGGATAWETPDGGQTWTSVASFGTPGSVSGIAKDALPEGRFDIIDTANTLVMQASTGDLSSVTYDALMSGANTFAVGVDGRWEIIRAQTCVEGDDGEWTLSNLLRGRAGTEWAASLHAAGDAIVYLGAGTAFVTQAASAIGLARTYRGITKGRTIDSASDIPFTYRGMNLECLSPIDINGHRDVGTLAWTIKWTRRGRVDNAWRDLVDVPLGEASESYVVEIYSNSSYTTLKRTLTSTTPTVGYTLAQQTTDFGGEVATIYVKVYQVSATVGTGIPLVASITRAVAPSQDYLFTYVASLLHFDGANGSTTFTDQKAKTWTRVGTPTISTTQSQFGGASGYFSSNRNITTPDHGDFNFGSGPFTIEFATYFTTAPGSSANPLPILRKWTTTNQQCFDIWIYYTGGGNWEFRFSYSTTGADTVTGLSSNSITDGWSPPVNSWCRWAICRSGNTLRFLWNGVVKKSVTMSATIFSGTSPVEFGCGDGSSAAVMYADELRLTREARYTYNYTPIAAPFQDA